VSPKAPAGNVIIISADCAALSTNNPVAAVAALFAVIVSQLTEPTELVLPSAFCSIISPFLPQK